MAVEAAVACLLDCAQTNDFLARAQCQKTLVKKWPGMIYKRFTLPATGARRDISKLHFKDSWLA